jgi:hypothetical protein
MKSQWQKEIFQNKDYWGKIIAIADDYFKIRELASKITSNYGCYTVPKNPYEARIRTCLIR